MTTSMDTNLIALWDGRLTFSASARPDLEAAFNLRHLLVCSDFPKTAPSACGKG